MAGENRTATHAVALGKALQEKPYKFGFFETMRRLECAYADAPRLGSSRRAADDPVRLGQDPSMAFATSTISSFDPGTRGIPRLGVLFFGLFGPNGPLPLHLTEYARDRLRNSNDPTFKSFADVFHHRLLTMFYRAWAAAQPTVNRDRPDSDRFATYVGAMFGMGMASLRNRDGVSDLTKLQFAGLLALQNRPAEGLRSILNGFFRLPVSIEPFVGQWFRLPEKSRCRLGSSTETGILGHTLMVGDRVWDCQHKFRIELGPMGLDDYRRMLPGGESNKRLTALVRNYVGNEMTWDARLILRKEEVPRFRLGDPAGLGRATWLLSRERDRDSDELLVSGPP